MNLQDAFDSHVQWKQKLTHYIHNPDGSLKADVVASANQCALGKWIDSAGQKYRALPQYEELKESHSAFHKTAGKIIQLAESGTLKSEEEVLGPKSDYSYHSMRVLSAIKQMELMLNNG
jgi:hypothetical protein